MPRASDTTKGAAQSYAGVVRQRPSGGVPRKRLRPLATFGGRMHPSDWSRLLTERQREVLTIVVENKVYRNRDSKIPELAAQMGIAPAAVAKHLLEIEKTALLNVVVSPSEQGKRVYERLELEPRPEAKQTAEALDRNTVTILRFLHLHPDASTTEVAEELGFSEYTTVNSLRVLMAVQLITNSAARRSDVACHPTCTGRRRTARTSQCGSPPRPARKAEIAATPLHPGMYDAVVVGAGPAGGMAARPLAAAGFRTAIIETHKN